MAEQAVHKINLTCWFSGLYLEQCSLLGRTGKLQGELEQGFYSIHYNKRGFSIQNDLSFSLTAGLNCKKCAIKVSNVKKNRGKKRKLHLSSPMLLTIMNSRAFNTNFR